MTEDYYYNTDWKCVEERDSGETCPRKQYAYGIRGRNDLVARDNYLYNSSSGSPSCSSAGKERHYALNDAMGSVTAVASTAGAVVERYSYTAFGQSQVMTTDFDDRSMSLYDWQTRFHGEQRDEETGFYNYGYRYYDPTTGRWPSRDPMGENGGLNIYGFIKNDGVNYLDYLGLVLVITGNGITSSNGTGVIIDGSISIVPGGGIQINGSITPTSSPAININTPQFSNINPSIGGAGSLPGSVGILPAVLVDAGNSIAHRAAIAQATKKCNELAKELRDDKFNTNEDCCFCCSFYIASTGNMHTGLTYNPRLWSVSVGNGRCNKEKPEGPVMGNNRGWRSAENKDKTPHLTYQAEGDIYIYRPPTLWERVLIGSHQLKIVGRERDVCLPKLKKGGE
jgi:RHS repeat-associated protein